MHENKKHELKDIQLYEERGQYYLRLKYIIEDDHRVEELEIPKVAINFNSNIYPTLNYTKDHYGCEECILIADYSRSLDVLFGKTSESVNHVFYTIKTLEEKVHELTLSEIEKKLGYKIKIISEENKND